MEDSFLSRYNKKRGGAVVDREFTKYYISIGLKVSYYRKLCGLTQEQLAEKMNVDTSFIGQIEAPNIIKAISLDTLFRISKTLDVPPYKFLQFD